MRNRHLDLVLAGSLALSVVAACSSNPPAPEGSDSGGSNGTGSGGAPMAGGPGGGMAGTTGGRGGTPGTGGGQATGGSTGSTGGSTGGGTGGMTGGGGSGGTAGRGGTGGAASGGTGGAGAGGMRDAGPTDAAPPDAVQGDGANLARFSFFYTSLDAMLRLSNTKAGLGGGFGGDLRFGEATGLEGADKICQTIAAGVGFGAKKWKAFLSATKGPDGKVVNAIDRIGEGPWYDRNGRLIAMNRTGLLTGDRPMGDAQAVNDLPDETGQGTKRLGDTHDVITGSNRMGTLYSTNAAATCQDWTSVVGKGPVMCGHAWPAFSGMHWIQAHGEPSCQAGTNLVQMGSGNGSSIGAGGGWGGFYCFALQP